MRRKPTPAQRARQLKSIGVDFGFPLNRTLTPQAKGWITRRWRDYAGYFHKENHMRLVKAKPGQLAALRKALPRENVTAKGALVQVPKGARARVEKKTGRLVVTKGRLREETFKLSSKRFAQDAAGEMQRILAQAKGKMKRAFFTYRGFEGRTPFTSFAAFLASDSGPSSLATFALKEPGRFARNLGVKIVSTTPPRPSTTKRQTTHRHETTLPKVRKENPPRRHRHSVQAPARHRPKKRR